MGKLQLLLEQVPIPLPKHFLTKAADQAGADAFLLVAPYYNKPSQEGLCAHFSALAEVPKNQLFCIQFLQDAELKFPQKLSAGFAIKFPTFAPLRKRVGVLAKVSETLASTDDEFVVLSGDDGLTLPFMACGAKGVISVASNLVPDVVLGMVRHALEGDYTRCEKIAS